MFPLRYDYENIDNEPANKVIEGLRQKITDGSLVGKQFTGGTDNEAQKYDVELADDFSYTDPIDQSVSKKQVWKQSRYT